MHKLTPSPSDASFSNKEHVLNEIKFNEIGPIHKNPKMTDKSFNDIYIKPK
jgi:hypothetical protein